VRLITEELARAAIRPKAGIVLTGNRLARSRPGLKCPPTRVFLCASL
jgi:hypothetical protein